MKWSKPSLRTRVDGGWLLVVGCAPLLNEVMSRLEKHADWRNDEKNRVRARDANMVWFITGSQES